MRTDSEHQVFEKYYFQMRTISLNILNLSIPRFVRLVGIVGITLFTYSCFIFNVFTHIQEDVLQQLETFLNYGRLAVQKSDSK